MLFAEVEPGDSDRAVGTWRKLLFGLVVRHVPEQIGLIMERQLGLVLGLLREGVDERSGNIVGRQLHSDRRLPIVGKQRAARGIIEGPVEGEAVRFLEAADRVRKRRALLPVDHTW